MPTLALVMLAPSASGADTVLNCIACPAGFFLHMDGENATCETCFAHSTTFAFTNASKQTDCFCVAGYTNSSEECVPCAEHHFKSSSGNASCTACQTHTVTLTTNATSADDCVCIPGYTRVGAECVPCEAGSYKTTPGNHICIPCPANHFCVSGSTQPQPCRNDSESLPGTGFERGCVCTAGHYELPCSGDFCPGACADCAAGTYSETSNSSSCSLCPEDTFNPTLGADNLSACLSCHPNSGADAGATSQEECACNAGFTPTGSSDCQECAFGTYKTNRSDYICSLCPADYYNDAAGSTTFAACTKCPDNTISAPGAGSILQCICEPGFRHLNQSALHKCVSCDAGSYSESSNSSFCQKCAAGKFGITEASQTANDCLQCVDGSYSLLAGQTTCVECPVSSYQNLSDSTRHTHNCTSCPAYSSHTKTASTSITDCICEAGFMYKTNPYECIPCLASHYCPGDNTQLLCPNNTWSDSGAVHCSVCANNSFAFGSGNTENECLCKPGTAGLYNTNCTSCPPGTFQIEQDSRFCLPCSTGEYNNEFGQLSCQSCRPNSFSQTGAIQSIECHCLPGFYSLTADSECLECPAGFYCPGGLLKNICRPHSYSVSGSSHPSACACNAGYYSTNPTSNCDVCPPNFFCEGNMTRLPCSGNSLSPPGSNTNQNCSCINGHWRGCIQDMHGSYVNENGNCLIDYSLPCHECGADLVCINNTVLHCPANSSSLPASHLVEECECFGGFYVIALLHSDEHHSDEDHNE